VPDAAYELLWRRDGYGLAAAEAIGEHPWFGVGIGKFFALSTGYHQRVAGRAIPPDNAQNLWRQTLVEQGIVGLLPVLWLTCLALASLIGRPAADIDVVLRVMLLGFGAALLVGYPLQDSGIAVTFATLVCTVVAGTTDRRQASTGVQS
jgi:O-antigen ligase